jgi:tetratricopeptide (TPR) repeat protein
VCRAAIALMPQSGVSRVTLVRCMLAAGDLAEAEREARAFLAAMPGSEAWSLLSAVQRALDRREDALASAEAALKLAPKDRALQYNHAVALDRAGRTGDAVSAYEKIATEKLDTADLALNYARALYAKGRKQDSEAVLAESIKHWPGAGALHGALARVRWLRGEGEACTGLTEPLLTGPSANAALHLVCADALHKGGHEAKAERILREALKIAPESTAVQTALGVVLDELDRPEEGLAFLRAVAAKTGDSKVSLRNLLSTLLRAGRPEEALRIARALQKQDPDEQYVIASEASALRMLGDPQFRKLYDYERLVRTYEIPAPRGFFTADNFNVSLAECLRQMHRAWAHPLDQSLHEGTQTGRSLLSLGEPNLKALLGAVDEALRDYISALKPAPDDPLTRRKRRDFYRFSGLWSVRLTRGGFQPNHVHDKGWISSAYYVSTPATLGPNYAGWLKFGEPGRPLRGCGPEFLVEPRVGRLVLFPSYMWHGTVPFDVAEERLSAAFDVVPA